MNNNLKETELRVYGATCSWTGPISAVKKIQGIPVCPHCNGVLFQMEEKDWQDGIKMHSDRSSDVHYPAFVKWLETRGACSPIRNKGFEKLREEFNNLP